MFFVSITHLVFLTNLQFTEPHIKEPVVSEGPILFTTNKNLLTPNDELSSQKKGEKYIQFEVDFQDLETYTKYIRSISSKNTNPYTKVQLLLRKYSKDVSEDFFYTQEELNRSISFFRYTNFLITNKKTEEYKLVISINSYTQGTQIKSVCECLKYVNSAWQFVLVLYDIANQPYFARTCIFRLNKSQEYLKKIESRKIKNYQSTHTEIWQRKKILEKNKFSIVHASRKILQKVKECLNKTLNRTNPTTEVEGYE